MSHSPDSETGKKVLKPKDGPIAGEHPVSDAPEIHETQHQTAEEVRQQFEDQLNADGKPPKVDVRLRDNSSLTNKLSELREAATKEGKEVTISSKEGKEVSIQQIEENFKKEAIDTKESRERRLSFMDKVNAKLSKPWNFLKRTFGLKGKTPIEKTATVGLGVATFSSLKGFQLIKWLVQGTGKFVPTSVNELGVALGEFFKNTGIEVWNWLSQGAANSEIISSTITTINTAIGKVGLTTVVAKAAAVLKISASGLSTLLSGGYAAYIWPVIAGIVAVKGIGWLIGKYTEDQRKK